MAYRRYRFVSPLAAVLCFAPAVLNANVVLDPTAPGSLSLFGLGTVPSVNSHYPFGGFYEGIAISGNNLLLSVGDPTTSSQTIWALPLVRNNNHIVSFGAPAPFVTLPANPPSCGLCFGNI